MASYDDLDFEWSLLCKENECAAWTESGKCLIYLLYSKKNTYKVPSTTLFNQTTEVITLRTLKFIGSKLLIKYLHQNIAMFAYISFVSKFTS